MESLITPHLTTTSKAKSIFNNHIAQINQGEIAPHEFVKLMEEAWDSLDPKPDRSVHGTYFEYVIGESLAQRGIRNLYHQVTVRHVPLAKFDWLLYHETSPVSISCKISARERWKQAAIEAMVLKQVYANSTNYLVTIEKMPDASGKLALSPFALDEYVIATNREYDEMVEQIAQHTYVQAVEISPILRGRFIAVGESIR